MAAKPAENWMAVAAPVCVAAAGEVEPPTASASVELADLDSVVVMVDADVASVVVLPEPVGYGAVELATTGRMLVMLREYIREVCTHLVRWSQRKHW